MRLAMRIKMCIPVRGSQIVSDPYFVYYCTITTTSSIDKTFFFFKKVPTVTSSSVAIVNIVGAGERIVHVCGSVWVCEAYFKLFGQIQF